jgi:virulence factor Mce-like protein
MVTQAPKRAALGIALAFALSCVGLIIFVWTQFGGSIPFAAQGYRVKAVFPETGLLVPGADVRISGVNVGKVTGVQARGLNSLVTLDIRQQYAPIPADTMAILRTKTLLGEAYVELSTGTGTGSKLPDGGTLPAAHVERAQELDQVLGSFTPTVQHNLQALLTGSGVALAGRGQDLNDAFGNFDPAITELAAVVGVLNQQQPGVRSLVRDGATVLGTVGSRRADVQSLIGAGDQVLATTAARNAALRHTVEALPPFLGQLRTTLGHLNTTLGIAGPSLHTLAPTAPLLAPALRGLNGLSLPVLDLLRRAPRLMRISEVALPAMTRFAQAFRPAVEEQLKVALQVAPIINAVYRYPRELVTGMANLAALLIARAPANTPSGSAAYLRALITLGPDSVYGQTQRAPAYRGNTYFAPGELSNMNHGGLRTSSCSNVHDAAEVPVFQVNVACRVQRAFRWGHGIMTAYFPRVRAYRVGAARRRRGG